MQKQNAILGTVVRITPPGREAAAEAAREATVEFEDGRSARLEPGDRRADGYLRVLEGLRNAGLPAYVEVEPATGRITVLRVPVVVRVEEVREDAAGDLEVALHVSHARHHLRRANPDFDALAAALRDARRTGDPVAVAETESHEIVAVIPFRPRAELLPPEPLPRPWFLLRLIRWILWWLRWRRCVSQRRAQELFDLVASTTCDPLTVPPPCIPFLYPDDGCWGRAHEMCRLMIQAGASPRKVWIYGRLATPTKNNPNCIVYWGWHVAPTLCVRRRLFWFFWWRREMVIDPSLFATPVTRATWKGVQGDPAAQLVGTSADVFHRSSGGNLTYDPTYAQTNAVLTTYRLALQTRSINVGPPPYANCP
jgi:hypothetical protein